MLRLGLSFFILGLSFGFGPCLASCGPLLISYLAGTQKSAAKGILTYILFSAGRIFVYLVLGLSIFLFGSFITEHIPGGYSRYLYLAGGIFIVIIGLLVALGRDTKHNLCLRLNEILLKDDKKTVILMGLLAGILPCAPFISVISFIALAAKNWALSLFYSFAFGLGTVFSPLLALAALSGLIPAFLKNNRAQRALNIACGLIICLLGLQLALKGIRYA